MGKKYTALTPIEHDGVRVEEGGSLTLEQASADPLLKLGAIKEGTDRMRAPKPPTDPITIQGAGDSTPVDGEAPPAA